MSKKINYHEGDWFAVPLQSGGFGVGIVSRMNGRGIVFGYFLKPRREEIFSLPATTMLSPRDAVLVCQFGDLGLINHRWPIVGRDPQWNRQRWPMPPFGHRDALRPIAWRREYDEDRLKQIREVLISEDEYAKLPKDGLFGYIAVETVLNSIFDGGSPFYSGSNLEGSI